MGLSEERPSPYCPIQGIQCSAKKCEAVEKQEEKVFPRDKAVTKTWLTCGSEVHLIGDIK